MTTLAEIAKVLETTEKNVLNRAAGLRLLPVCTRCGGSGRYSFNQMDGDRCFGCKGSGQNTPKPLQLPEVLAGAVACKTDGRFAAYMLYLDARKTTKGAIDKAMKAWTDTGISDAYKWQNAVKSEHNKNYCERDRDIADINKKMCDAYSTVSEASFGLDSRKPTFQADVVALAGILAAALAAIEAANQEFIAYVKKGG